MSSDNLRLVHFYSVVSVLMVASNQSLVEMMFCALSEWERSEEEIRVRSAYVRIPLWVGSGRRNDCCQPSTAARTFPEPSYQAVFRHFGRSTRTTSTP